MRSPLMVALLATLILSTSAGRVSAGNPATTISIPAMTTTPNTLLATTPIFADGTTDGIKKFVDGVANNGVFALVILVALVAVVLWSRAENNVSGTIGRSPWVILLVGVVLGIFLCKGFQGDLGGPGVPPGAADDAGSYVDFDAAKNEIKLKTSPVVPTGYRVVTSKDDKGKDRQFVSTTPANVGAGEVWVYLDPITATAGPAKGLKKLR